MKSDERLEALLNRAGQTISDLPENYGKADRLMALEAAKAWNNTGVIYSNNYICHLTDIIDRLENALENQVTLHEHLIHVIGNADIPDGVSYDQFCLVVDSIYLAIQTAQEGWENYEEGVPKDGGADDDD